MMSMIITEVRRLRRRWPAALALFGLGLMRVVLRGVQPGSSVPQVLRYDWQGLPPHASVVTAFLWIMVPVSWGILVGEPWAADRRKWQRFVASRTGTRWALWSGSIAALFGSTLVAVVLLLSGSLVGAVSIAHAPWRLTIWPTLRHVAVMLLGMLWPYAALMIALLAIIRQPGWALVGTLGLGYMGTLWMAGTGLRIRYWVPPLAGQNPFGSVSDGRVVSITVSYAVFLLAAHWVYWRRHGL